MKRVVISGVGALTPIGNNTSTFWENCIKGTSGANAITKFDVSKFKTRFACELKKFDPLDYLDKSEVRRYDSFSQYGLIAAQEAIANAQINF